MWISADMEVEGCSDPLTNAFCSASSSTTEKDHIENDVMYCQHYKADILYKLW
jgi:hypothetical protein